MKQKRELLDALLPLMRENVTEPKLLEVMQGPEWLEKISVENLEFLLQKHRELSALHRENEGLFEKWNRAREVRGNDDA